MHQDILSKVDTLEEETGKLLSAIESLTEADLHDETYGWSIIQVFSHLNTAELGSVLYMKKKMKAGEAMDNYGFSNKLRFTLVKGLLQSSLKWKAPKVVANPKGDYSFEEIKVEWEKTRNIIRDYISNFPEHLISKAVYKHPFAGRLNLAAAIDSFIYHQRHHIHQVKRIRKKIRR